MKHSPTLNLGYPAHPLLQAQIAFYYFFAEADEQAQLCFQHYPHVSSTLNLFRQGQVELRDGIRCYRGQADTPPIAYYSRNMKGAKTAELKGAFDIIGIVFHPLGIHHFVSDSLAEMGDEFHFSQWGDSLSMLARCVCAAPTLAEKIAQLDHYLLARYCGFSAPTLSYAVGETLRLKGAISLQQLSQQAGVSRRTLVRHFRQYLNCSFREFKAVVKFRSALSLPFSARKLSDLGQDSTYYDQSDLIRQFKRKTTRTPKQLLRKLTPIGDQQLLWCFSD